ncbi:hypothetical protein PO878_14750 [Iamia majanohamensis]|uniref:Uncharacterized protein n=1 Tax=Iamia majanohamensis TaxID=467976 RepID=A0AAE9Y5F8_9ACTN|nr:hypothetical protein [Iamia majanohamensis]WCO65761.1 hypothetical protein PO878_14750 [Iamia majanohamensis]
MIRRTPDHDSALATHTRLHHDAGLRPPALDPHGPDTAPSPMRAEVPGPIHEPNKPGDEAVDAQVREIQARLDRLETHGQSRSIGR